MTTIKDLLLAPYEIDVDLRNFTVVEVKVTTGGKVAGRETEAGIKKRYVVGHYSTLSGAVNCIIKEKANSGIEEIDGTVVTLKKFLGAQDKYASIIRSFMMRLDFKTPRDLAEVTPSKFLKGSGEVVESVTEEEE